MKKENEIQELLRWYYDVDLDNCCMSHDRWIEELSKAIANPSKYVEQLKEELKSYENERNA